MDFDQNSAWSKMPTEEELLMMQLAQSQGEDPAMAAQALPPKAPAAMPSLPAQPVKGAAPAPNPMIAQMQALQKKALDEDKKGIGVYEKSINDLLGKANGSIDFSPLAALADAWSPGSHLTQAAIAAKPMTDEQRKVLATKLQDELQRRKGDYTKAQLDAAKTQLLFALGIEKAGKPKDPSADQSKAALFGKRMEQSEGVFSELAAKGYDPTTGMQAVERWGLFPEGQKDENTKRQQQAEANFLNAVLRRESGAAISDGEREEGAKQYFPRQNDPPTVLAQKKANRELAKAGLATEAGPAWGRLAIPETAAPVTKTYQGKTYQLQPGADPKKQESWAVVQ